MRNKLKRLIAKRPPLQSLQERGLLRGEVGWGPADSFLLHVCCSGLTFLIWASAHFTDETTSAKLSVEVLRTIIIIDQRCPETTAFPSTADYWGVRGLLLLAQAWNRQPGRPSQLWGECLC